MNANRFWVFQFSNYISSYSEIWILINSLRNTTQNFMIRFKNMRKTSANSWSSLNSWISNFSTIIRISYTKTSFNLIKCQMFLKSAYIRIHMTFYKSKIPIYYVSKNIKVFSKLKSNAKISFIFENPNF